MKRAAHAKINLFLRVLSLREDAYHDLESLIVPVSLADEIVCREARKLELRLAPGSLRVSRGPDNLVIVASLALAKACPGKGAEIELVKRIPVAAGLGGGSADAAAVLQALNELWGCSLSKEALQAVASQIGSDVPALLTGGPVLVGGRGERLEPVTVPPLWWVLVRFAFQIRTPDSYRWWDEDGSGTGPEPSDLIAAAARGDVDAMARRIFNDLEEPVFRRHAEVGDMKARLLDGGALGAIMCGSGPTVAGLCRSKEEAEGLAAKIPSAMIASSPP